MSNLFLSLEIGGLQWRFKLERKEIGAVLKYSECPNETQLWHKLFHLILPSKFIPACIFEILTIVTDICKHKQNKCHANYIHAKPNVRKQIFSQLMRKLNLEVTEKRVENYIFRIRRERLKGCLSRELHFSYESRKSQRGLKSRITFLLSG